MRFHHLRESKANLARAMTPSLVLQPPMKPAACTKTQPSTPVNSDNFSSLMPLQGSGRPNLNSKLEEVTDTVEILHEALESWNKTNLMSPCALFSFSME